MSADRIRAAARHAGAMAAGSASPFVRSADDVARLVAEAFEQGAAMVERDKEGDAEHIRTLCLDLAAEGAQCIELRKRIDILANDVLIFRTLLEKERNKSERA